MTPAHRYLRLPADYCDYLGGLRWSAVDDTLEFKDGTTFAFNEQVALFLEGFASTGRLVHFAYLLHLLHLLANWHRQVAAPRLRFCNAYAETGRPLRNAGALCGILCRRVPEATGPLNLQNILVLLRDPTHPMRWQIASVHDPDVYTELPPLGPAAFEQEILQQLEDYRMEDLRAWFRHGRGPICGAGEILARTLPPPRTLLGALAALLERPRLAGARSFVDQLLGALALPPRRNVRPAAPQGGFADVTTYGPPDRLLPSQFALDELDFLRRFADHELLYFRREEPHTLTRHELVVLLDQGVRTWGDVRLVLAAAVLALGKQAARKKLPFLVATTSGGGQPLDPVAADDETLGELMEASDLSANPGLALERVLDQSATGSRDVVMLTHPRNLREDDVRTAALRATPETRLLALTLDAHGRATLAELRHGAAVPIRQFRVDFNAAPPPAPDLPPDRPGAWRGDVEPVGFPFRFGSNLFSGTDLFDFDYDGRWLLTADQHGTLHAWATDGSHDVELLPRARLDGELLGKVEAVVGVRGGFVVISRGQARLTAAYYNFDKRTCAAYALDNGARGQDWCYSPEHHTVLSYISSGSLTHALDLGTGSVFPGGKTEAWSRIEQVWEAVCQGRVPARRLMCVIASGSFRAPAQICHLDTERGELQLTGVVPAWEPFIPLADGRPVLAGSTPYAAKCRGNVLAALFNNWKHGSRWTLRLFRGPMGTPLAEYPAERANYGFALSGDGRLLAQQSVGGAVQVCTVEGGEIVVQTYTGGYAQPKPIRLGDAWIMVRKGKRHLHCISWESGRLELTHTRSNKTLDQGMETTGTALIFAGVPASLHYDRKRFAAGATTTVTAVVDWFDQVAILDVQGNLVCMFFAFRDRVSGWLPDGTCFGPDSHSKEPPTPHVLDKFGRALTRASELGRALACI